MNSKYSRYFSYIKPVLRNPKVQSYSTLVFNIIAASFFILLALKPTITTILALQKSVDEKKQVASQLHQKAVTLTSAKQNFSQIPSSTLDKLGSILPDETNITNLADDLNSLGSQYDASVSAIQFQPTDLIGKPQQINPSPTLKEIDFTFSVLSDYQTTLNLLKDLTNHDRLIAISSINFATKNQSSNMVTTINAKAFFLEN